MRVETLELLRCPAPHEPAVLVTVAYERHGDRIVEGALGCMVCGAEYPLREGVADLRADTATRIAPDAAPRATIDAGRLAALLSLTEFGARIALCGAYANVADEIELLATAHCIAINADTPALAIADCVAIDRDSAAVPMANAALRGLAIDHAHRALLHDASRVVRVGGRIVAPVTLPVPLTCRELARDAHEWVAEVVAESQTLIPLRIAPR